MYIQAISDELNRFISNHNNGAKFADLQFGTFTGEEVITDQNIHIPLNALIIPQHFTDHKVNIEIQFEDGEFTIEGGTPTRCKYKGKVKILNHIKKDDILLLLNKSDGQQYFVLAKYSKEEEE